jgi:hypothetical protein
MHAAHALLQRNALQIGIAALKSLATLAGGLIICIDQVVIEL